jgi:hypothetical protein
MQLCRCAHLFDDESAQSKKALAASTQGLMSPPKAKGAHGEVLVPPRAEVSHSCPPFPPPQPCAPSHTRRGLFLKIR